MARRVKNAAARALSLPFFRIKMVRSGKGKGSYRRNKRHREQILYDASCFFRYV